MYMAFSKTPVFSKKESIHPYSKGADGMLIGEGSVMMIIKKLSAAQRDGDTIHAVIRGCSAASDGHSSGIYTPVIEGQETAIRRCYERSGVTRPRCRWWKATAPARTGGTRSSSPL
jgi:acyl transferase domain-containing protein